MSLNGLIGIKDEVTQSSKEQKRNPSHIMSVFTVLLLRIINIEYLLGTSKILNSSP